MLNNYATQSRGFTLIEALVSLFILVGGLLFLLAFEAILHRSSGEARAQAEAASLAERKLNELAGFLSSSDVRLAMDADCPDGVPEGGITTFDVRCDISAANPREVRVAVSWQDGDGQRQEAVLESMIRLSDPDRDMVGLVNLVRAAERAEEGMDLWPAVSLSDADNGEDSENSQEGNDPPVSDDDELPQDPADPELPQPLKLQTRVISGVTHGAGESDGAPDILAVTAHATPPSIAAHCAQPGGTRFRCTVSYADPRAGWSGSITIVAQGTQRLRNDAQCANSITLLFTGVTEDIDDVELVAC